MSEKSETKFQIAHEKELPDGNLDLVDFTDFKNDGAVIHHLTECTAPDLVYQYIVFELDEDDETINRQRADEWLEGQGYILHHEIAPVWKPSKLEPEWDYFRFDHKIEGESFCGRQHVATPFPWMLSYDVTRITKTEYDEWAAKEAKKAKAEEDAANVDLDASHLDGWLDETLTKTDDNPEMAEFVVSPAPCFFCHENPADCACTEQSRLEHSLDMLSVDEVIDRGYARMASGRYERICRPVERPFSRFIIDADPEAWVSLVNAYADELLRCPFENDWLPGDSIVAKEMAAALIWARYCRETYDDKTVDDALLDKLYDALDMVIPKPFDWKARRVTVQEHRDLLCKIVDQGLPITETDEIEAVKEIEPEPDWVAVNRDKWEAACGAADDFYALRLQIDQMLDAAGVPGILSDELRETPGTKLEQTRIQLLIDQRDKLKSTLVELVRVGDMTPGIGKVNALIALIELARELVK
jgi:hypothetical protein